MRANGLVGKNAIVIVKLDDETIMTEGLVVSYSESKTVYSLEQEWDEGQITIRLDAVVR